MKLVRPRRGGPIPRELAGVSRNGSYNLARPFFVWAPIIPIRGLTPISDIDLMIRNGWGDTPQTKLPKDWRTRTKKGRSAKDELVKP